MKSRYDRGISPVLAGVLVGLGVLGALAFFSELPALRRYMKMSRM
jgi:hypothetical protein